MYQNYTTGQTVLTLNLDFTISNNHLANTISCFVDSIPEDVLLGDTAKTGRPAYHPAMMLKILLFAFIDGTKIEADANRYNPNWQYLKEKTKESSPKS